MRSTFLVVLIISCFSFSLKAQYTPENKQAIKAQLGVASVWLSYERQLFNSITARVELGLGTWEAPLSGHWVPTYYTPRWNVQARWYYANKSRLAKGKPVNNFTGAFLSIGATQEIRRAYDFSTWSTIHLAPQIGYSGSLGTNLNYEFSIGPGIQYFTSSDTWHFLPKGTIRFGYTF